MIGTLWRMALRNAKRHRAQAVAAAATVMVGTAVLAASLASGQAARSGITEIAYDILGEMDERVRTEGDFFFPAAAAEDFAREVGERAPLAAVSPAIVHAGVVGTPDGLTEPNTLLIGLPPDEQGFGSFQAIEGRATLAAGSALVNERLADKLAVRAGDELELRYARPIDPYLPTILRFPGNITSASPPVPGLPLPTGPPGALTFEVDVPAEATRLIAVLLWGSATNATDLDLALVSPSGARTSDEEGSTGAPDAPAILDLVAEEGGWTATVSAKAAANQPFRLFVLVLEPAYSVEQLREARDRLEGLGPLADRFRPGTLTEVTRMPVAGVVAQDGKGGFLGEAAVFLDLADLQDMLARPADVNVVRVSNAGGVRAGLAETDEMMPLLHASLNATKERFASPAVQALTIEPTKREIVATAEMAGQQFTLFLTTLSSFTILAGVLLVVNLFTMLGEERRIELSVMRALGMRRRHLVGSMTLEGSLYALPGAPVGALLGIALAWGLIRVINEFVASQDALPIPFIIAWWTPVVAALYALAFVLVAVALTGWNLSRQNIAAGLKGLREERAARRSRRALVIVCAGLALSGLAFFTGSFTLYYLGPTALIYGGALLAARRRSPDLGRFIGAALAIPYGLWTVSAFSSVGSNEAPILAPARGTALVLLAVVLLLNIPGLARALKGAARRFGRRAPATMVALSYPTTRRLRTGLTASMFALVLLVLAVFSTFFTVFAVDPERESGGYDIYAETALPVESLEQWAAANLDARPASLDRVALVDTMATVTVIGGDIVQLEGERPQYNGPPIDYFYGVETDFIEHNSYDLVARMPQFADDAAAYRSLLDDPQNLVLSRQYDVDEVGRLGRIEGGEELTVKLASGRVNFTVVGAQEQLYLGGIFLARDTLVDLFPTHGTAFLMRVAAGEDDTLVAQALERDFRELGLDVESIRDEAQRLQELNARFFAVLEVFLGLGLVIGVASLGIMVAKSALEREHELGVLRALGLPANQITWSLIAEAMFTAVLGIIPGILIGIAVAYAAYNAFFEGTGIPFSVPWGGILVLALISLLATLVSTVPPARKAARTDVSKAVRVQL